MAILTISSTLALGSQSTFTLNKADLLAHSSISGHSLMGDSTKWKDLYVIYESSSSNQRKVLWFDCSEASPQATWTPTANFKGYGEVSGVILKDKNGGSLYIPRSDLTTAEFDMAFVSGGGGGGGDTDLMANGNFASGTFASWSTVANDPGANSPVLHTFSPSSGSYTQSAPSGANNYYVQGASGDTSTAESSIFQDIDVSSHQSSEFTLTANLGGRFSDDGAFVSVEFYDDGPVLIDEPNKSIIYTDTYYTAWEGTFIKTSLRGFIDYSSGYKFSTSDTSYPVYKLLGTENKLMMKQKAFGGDRWEVYEGTTWEFSDLVDTFDIGSSGTNYESTIVSTSGDSSHAGDSLNYPPTDQSELIRFSDHLVIGYVAESRYIDAGSYAEMFAELTLTENIPANAETARIRASFLEESGSTCYAFVEQIKFEV